MNFRNYGNEPPGGGMTSPDIFSLARQSSVYSLTFDEFQSTRGVSIAKDFGSMNMDELLKNIWSVEETQQIVGSTSAQQVINGTPSNYLQRQGSLTLPRTLSQKTVDEVWRDLSNNVCEKSKMPPRQQTLGEVTLEEFLVRAGVVREEVKIPEKTQDFDLLGDLTRSVTNQPLGFGFQQMGNRVENNNNNNNNNILPLPVRTTQQQQQPQQIFPKPTLDYQVLPNDFGYPVQTKNCARIADPMLNANLVPNMAFGTIGNGVTVATSSPTVSSEGIGNGDISSLSPVPYVFTNGLRGRRGNNAVEKVIERRQRRMIKNRESAARSRARKQAYTMELEAEIAKLKEENQELQKKQAEIMEMQKNQVVEMMNKQQGGKRRRLKRTQTGPW